MKKTKLFALALLAAGTLICACSCNRNKDSGENVAPTEYDESGFQGSGMSGVPDLFDRVGYGTEASYHFGEDGSVTLNGNFYAPIKNSRTAVGKVIETTVSRADGQSEATQSPLTGAVYFLSESVRYRLYVVGENTEYSYLVINGIKSVSGGSSVNYERRYKIPLAGYKTGAPIKMKVVLTDGECDVTLAAAASRIYCKITDKTSYESTSGFETSLTYFFGSGEKAVGLESLDVSACFGDTSLLLGDEYANTELDRQKLSVSISNVTDGQNSVVGGSVSVSEEKPFRGNSVKVCVAPKEGYYLESLKINGENYKNRLTPTKISGVENYVYEIAGIQTDTLIAATFKSGEEKKYLVCGEYAYSSGIYDENSGKCTNDGDELTVSAGIYRGTAANGSFEIYLPDGEHFINLESKFFPAAEKSVTVYGEEQSDVKITFERLTYSPEMRFNGDNSVTFSAKESVRMIEGAVADEGFVFEYTVKGGVGAWFNTGGLYITYDDKTTSGDKEVATVNYDWLFVYNTSKRAEVVLIQQISRQDNGPAYLTSYPYKDLKSPIKVTVTYYNGSYYFAFDDKYAMEINKSTPYNPEQGTLNAQKFFGAKTRRLGLKNYDSAATFSSVSYRLGNAAAKAEIAAMKTKYTLETGAGGTAKFVEKGVTLSGNTCQRTIGTELSVVIEPENGKFVDKFIVGGKDRRSALQGPFVEYDENGENAKRVYRYDFGAEKGEKIISVTFSDTEKKYTVSGSCVAESGAEVTIVRAGGGYEGKAENGRFSIDLPCGTHVLYFESADGQIATRKAEIKADGQSSDNNLGEIKLSFVSLESGTGIAEAESGVYNLRYGTGNDFHYFTAGGERIETADAFVAEFTMQNDVTSRFYKSCALFAEKGSTTHSLFILKQGNNALIGLYDPAAGNNSDGSAYYTVGNADYNETSVTKVKIVFYKKAYYISFGKVSVKISVKEIGKMQFADQITNEFFSCGIRTLGIRIKDVGATVSGISVKTGEENAEKAVRDGGFENNN